MSVLECNAELEKVLLCEDKTNCFHFVHGITLCMCMGLVKEMLEAPGNLVNAVLYEVI